MPDLYLKMHPLKNEEPRCRYMGPYLEIHTIICRANKLVMNIKERYTRLTYQYVRKVQSDRELKIFIINLLVNMDLKKCNLFKDLVEDIFESRRNSYKQPQHI